MAEIRGGSKVGGYTMLHSGMPNAYMGGNLSITGNVGIGTVLPETKLHVAGQLLASNNVVSINNASYSQGNIQMRTSDASSPTIGFHKSGYTGVALYHNGTTGAQGTDYLRIRASDGFDSALAFAGRKTAAALNAWATLPSGIYANSGDGLLTPTGTVYKGGWFHVIHSKHDADGYAGQIAIPLSPGAAGDANMYMRWANAGTWGNWTIIGGARTVVPVGTDLYAT